MQFDYTIVAISNRFPTEPYYCLEEWHKSVKGTNHVVIDAIESKFQGLGDKPKFVYRAIKRGYIKTKYIIFCDCWDLVFASTPEEIIEKYLEFNADLVFSAEKNCFPSDLKEEYDKLPNTGTSYKYLNSGMIVGLTDSLLTTLEAMEVEKIPNDYWDNERRCNIHFNDQFEYQKIFLKQPVKMVLDHNQVLSNALHQVKLEELDFSEDRIKNIETGSYPCTWHMNGSGKTDGLREPILKKLGL